MKKEEHGNAYSDRKEIRLVIQTYYISYINNL